jgi:hypothetical protein
MCFARYREKDRKHKLMLNKDNSNERILEWITVATSRPLPIEQGGEWQL